MISINTDATVERLWISDLPLLEKALQDEKASIRRLATVYLGMIKDEQVQAAVNDPEFEVSLQINMAIERIEGGTEALGSVWKQMTEARNNNKY